MSKPATDPLDSERAKYRRRGVVRTDKYAPFHTEVRLLADPATGESIGALVPCTPTDARQMRERGMKVGSRWKTHCQQERDSRLWRFAHLLGGYLSDHVEGFEGLGAHDALKELQKRSGIGCMTTRSDIRDRDGVLQYRIVNHQPLSLAYDLMDEGEFRQLWDGGVEGRGNAGWLGYLRRVIYAGMDAPSIDELERMIVGEVPSWVE